MAAGKWASSILKVARTIADLAASENILAEHVGEAIQYVRSIEICGHDP